jgi:Leucine-rich repeat (LRR) protein
VPGGQRGAGEELSGGARSKMESVGATTDVASLKDQVQLRFRPRCLARRDEDPVAAAGKSAMGRRAQTRMTPKPLRDLCVTTIADHFEQLPVYEEMSYLPPSYLQSLTAQLSISLCPRVCALYVFDEGYWKRRCMGQLKRHECRLSEHGMSWKQLFFEHHAASVLENLQADSPTDDVMRLLKACQDYIVSLRLRQMLRHVDIAHVVRALPNLARLDLTYGVKSIGMAYDRVLFGMKISDASSLAKAVAGAPLLSTLILQRNLVDDDLLRLLMVGLEECSTVTFLDLSHNKITNHGARMLSKLLGKDSVLSTLRIVDNQIHAEGGRYFGRALRENESLVELDMRLNRLTDEGGHMLLEGVKGNSTLTSLGVGGNMLGHESSLALCGILQGSQSPITSVDLSCNELEDVDLKLIRQSLEENQALTSIDLRRNKFSSSTESCELLEEIDAIVQRNELKTEEQQGQGG